MQRRMLVATMLALALAFLVVGSMATSAGAGGRPLDAVLTGAAEAPGPGDPDGSGTADLRLNQGQRTVCWELTWQGIDPPIAAHIHVGPVGVAGGVVVGLFLTPETATNRGCAEGVDRDLIKDIRKNPDQYYVNVHTGPFPGGAIRGQLSK